MASSRASQDGASQDGANPDAEPGMPWIDHLTPEVADEPTTEMRIDPALPTHCNLEDELIAPAHWTPEQNYGQDGSTQDFGHVLRQLGIGVSSNFWDMERPMLPSLTDLGAAPIPVPGHAPLSGATDRVLQAHSPVGVARYFASPPRSTTNSANGRVSSLELLTKRDADGENVRRSVPAGVFIRKDETVANYIGLFFKRCRVLALVAFSNA